MCYSIYNVINLILEIIFVSGSNPTEEEIEDMIDVRKFFTVLHTHWAGKLEPHTHTHWDDQSCCLTHTLE